MAPWPLRTPPFPGRAAKAPGRASLAEAASHFLLDQSCPNRSADAGVLPGGTVRRGRPDPSPQRPTLPFRDAPQSGLQSRPSASDD